jgi:competence ComEA-like helix-hairpin-helix protein
MTDLDKIPGIGKKRVELLSQYFEVTGVPATPDTQRVTVPVDRQPIPETVENFSPGVWLETQFLPVAVPLVGWGIGVVNINLANQVELESLPEIGEVLAGRIIEDRMKNGPFLERQDIMRVHGIGEKTFQKIEPWITVGY